MTCHLVQSLLDDYLDGDLTAREIEEIDSHLAVCPVCREEHIRSVELKRVLSSRTAPDPGPQYFREVTELILARTVDQAEIEHRQTRGATDFSRNRAPFFRSLIAAAASIALFVTSLYMGSSRPMTATAPPARFGVRAGQATSMAALLHSEDNQIMTDAEKLRVASGMVLLGAPGMAGRYTDMATMLEAK